jgi:hypothetical protein
MPTKKILITLAIRVQTTVLFIVGICSVFCHLFVPFQFPLGILCFMASCNLRQNMVSLDEIKEIIYLCVEGLEFSMIVYEWAFFVILINFETPLFDIIFTKFRKDKSSIFNKL